MAERVGLTLAVLRARALRAAHSIRRPTPFRVVVEPTAWALINRPQIIQKATIRVAFCIMAERCRRFANLSEHKIAYFTDACQVHG